MKFYRSLKYGIPLGLLGWLLLGLCFLGISRAGELVSSHAEREHLGGGKYRTTIHSAPVAYQEAGVWKRISSNWTDGDAEHPQIVATSQLKVYTAPDGMRRICPTGDLQKYVEIGAPLVQNASNAWIKPSFTGPVRSGNKLTWSNAQAVMVVTHLGSGIKLDIELLNSYIPRNSKFAFPVGIQGLTRSGSQILDGSTVVMLLRAPVVYDAANPQDVRPIAWQFVNGNIVFTLPSISDMSRPVVDPTVTIQPDSTGFDCVMSQAAPNTAYPNNTAWQVGEDPGGVDWNFRALILFPQTSIPATFTSATLYLYAVTDYAANASTYRVYPLTQAWTESATWNKYDGSSVWPGGAGAGGDIGAAIGSRNFTAAETVNEFKVFPLTPTTLAGLGSLGWLIMADVGADNSYQFVSFDNATPANRPKLVVEHEDDVSGAMLLCN